jgi:hypothetical protein
MPDVVTDGFERKATIHQSLNAGMPQRMGSWPGHWDAGLVQVLAGNARHRGMGKLRSRRKVPPEEHSALHIGPAVLQVVDDGLADDGRQRISGGVIGLALTYMQSIALPVDVIERERRDLPGTQPICDHEQQHSVVAPSDDRAPLDLIEHFLDGIPADRPRDVRQSIVLRHLNQLAEVAV